MAKNTQNLPTTYFTQKNRDKLEGRLFAGGAVGLIAFLVCYLTFYWYYSMIGLYIGGSCIIAYIVITAKKVKDGDFDANLEDFIEKNKLAPTAKYSLRLYDGDRGYAKIGKDRKLRSSIYCISEFDFTRELYKLSLTEIDLCATPDGMPSVINKRYSLPAGTPFRVEEREVKIDESPKKLSYLVLSPEDAPEIRIPIDQTSCDSDEIIAKMKKG